MPSAFDDIYQDLKGVEAEVNALLKECTTLVNYWGSGEFDRSAAEMLADAKNAIKLYTARDAILKAAKATEAVLDPGIMNKINAMGRVEDALDNLSGGGGSGYSSGW